MRSLYLALALLVIGPALSADTIWNVSGTIASAGNNDSTVSIDYSFVLDAGAAIGPNPAYILSDKQVSGNGSLGTAFTMGPWIEDGGAAGYIPIFDSAGDEIDLVSDYLPIYAEWWKCLSIECFDDFLPVALQARYPGSPGPIVTDIGFQGAYPFTMTQMMVDPPAETPTPEPLTIILALFGTLAIILLDITTHGSKLHRVR